VMALFTLSNLWIAWHRVLCTAVTCVQRGDAARERPRMRSENGRRSVRRRDFRDEKHDGDTAAHCSMQCALFRCP